MTDHVHYDTIILGAGAAGMMCAAKAAANGGRVLVIDHAKSAGDKIRISGGGRCNFTNMYIEPENFISENPHFAKSALSRYTQWDFIEMVANYGIAYHEKTLGQLFCDGSAKEIIAMLRSEMDKVGVDLWLETSLDELRHEDEFHVQVTRDDRYHFLRATNFVVACGGYSIPKMGATGLGYEIADYFGLPQVATRPALVPLTFGGELLEELATMSGTALDARMSFENTSFDEAILFTHRGMSGPAVLQISSYWRRGEPVSANLMPHRNALDWLREKRSGAGAKAISTILADYFPKKLAHNIAKRANLTGNMSDQSDVSLKILADAITNWEVLPNGSEGYRTAEVTAGGVSTDNLDSKTMATKALPNLYFIGEVVDVTGWLGGYNFQWAWSSGWAAGTAIANAAPPKG
ncbi:predicted oxidoreductase with FAD/NAD(P)-binding domain [Rhodobacteraceae bacterium HTCC2150]|nr:predicted oxidoreductase with FAD/NAD(P)-binding domain [Rhodobacteraceae bacterium HTCC2150]